jgi:serine/threonine protein kinase
VDSHRHALVGDFGLAIRKVNFLGGGIAEEEQVRLSKDELMQMPTTETLRWLPPETWSQKGAEPDFGSDIYSFAMTAWEVQSPFPVPLGFYLHFAHDPNCHCRF